MANKIRLGMVGASTGSTWAARAHLPALPFSPDFELTAVCTTKPQSAEAARANVMPGGGSPEEFSRSRQRKRRTRWTP